jgi:hypothetical protein
LCQLSKETSAPRLKVNVSPFEHQTIITASGSKITELGSGNSFARHTVPFINDISVCYLKEAADNPCP